MRAHFGILLGWNRRTENCVFFFGGRNWTHMYDDWHFCRRCCFWCHLARAHAPCAFDASAEGTNEQIPFNIMCVFMLNVTIKCHVVLQEACASDWLSASAIIDGTVALQRSNIYAAAETSLAFEDWLGNWCGRKRAKMDFRPFRCVCVCWIVLWHFCIMACHVWYPIFN